MKVLLISPFSDRLVGGIINWTKYIVSYHKDHLSEVDLSLLYNEKASQVLDTSSSLVRFRKGLSNYLPVIRLFQKEVHSKRYDLVHICTSASYGLIRDLLIVREARKMGIKTIAHMHLGRIPQILKSKGWERLLLLRLVKAVNCVTVMDRFSLEALHAYGIQNVVFLPNPLSPEVKKTIESSEDIERNQRKIVFAGHVIPTKGVEDLIKACSKISNIQLELVGKIPDNKYCDYLYDIAGKGFSSWLNIQGNKPFDYVIAEMKSCGVFVLPSYSEGFPNVILESMACGCPIVATLVGAIPEMLNPTGEKPCGICVPTGNVEELRKAICDILENERLANYLGQNAVERVNKFYSMPIVWHQLVDLWEGVCEMGCI